ncbi:hypothetical protein MKY96_15485 [Paenibacillus sp. FSL R7-0302]|uniref:hypothetical protein n=1 Tax=Paenibacillus sp. FSL R7-0302 TaxID=2921681 RepID=UPI0030F73295
MKLAKRKLIFLGVILFVFFSVLLLNLFLSNKNDINYRTDIEPINSRFPMLKNIQKVYWSSKVIDNRFGPISYWIRGYVFLDQTSILNIKDIYSWETVNIKPKMKYDFKGKTQSWGYSEEFDNFIKASNYVGKFYLDLNGDSLYFEIEQ